MRYLLSCINSTELRHPNTANSYNTSWTPHIYAKCSFALSKDKNLRRSCFNLSFPNCLLNPMLMANSSTNSTWSHTNYTGKKSRCIVNWSVSWLLSQMLQDLSILLKNCTASMSNWLKIPQVPMSNQWHTSWLVSGIVRFRSIIRQSDATIGV